ncbi:hypothetical protein BDR26DRAFT_281386 [Obelidium mucronatum]|nr:hypothetical protein BDR26DRAFT_281386 [Obelidium mucronatum]
MTSRPIRLPPVNQGPQNPEPSMDPPTPSRTPPSNDQQIFPSTSATTTGANTIKLQSSTTSFDTTATSMSLLEPPILSMATKTVSPASSLNTRYFSSDFRSPLQTSKRSSLSNGPVDDSFEIIRGPIQYEMALHYIWFGILLIALHFAEWTYIYFWTFPLCKGLPPHRFETR